MKRVDAVIGEALRLAGANRSKLVEVEVKGRTVVLSLPLLRKALKRVPDDTSFVIGEWQEEVVLFFSWSTGYMALRPVAVDDPAPLRINLEKAARLAKETTIRKAAQRLFPAGQLAFLQAQKRRRERIEAGNAVYQVILLADHRKKTKRGAVRIPPTEVLRLEPGMREKARRAVKKAEEHMPRPFSVRMQRAAKLFEKVAERVESRIPPNLDELRDEARKRRRLLVDLVNACYDHEPWPGEILVGAPQEVLDALKRARECYARWTRDSSMYRDFIEAKGIATSLFESFLEIDYLYPLWWTGHRPVAIAEPDLLEKLHYDLSRKVLRAEADIYRASVARKNALHALQAIEVLKGASLEEIRKVEEVTQ